MKKVSRLMLESFGLLVLALAISPEKPALADDPPAGTTNSAGTVEFVEPMTQMETIDVNGGVVAQGSPIAGDFDGADNVIATLGDNGTSTEIILSVPGTAVKKAVLYWTVLTDSDEASNRGQDITFDGEDISGTRIGFASGRTPCFFQFSTFAWKADVTSMVTTGPATHSVAGLPGENKVFGHDFAEGASLLVVFEDATQPSRQVVIYEGLAVTNSNGDTLSQTLTGFVANDPGPVVAQWLPVVGNGQVAGEDLSFTGDQGTIDFSNDLLLDGSTSMFPRDSASYLDSVQTDVFWDDDAPDVSSAIGPGSTSASVAYTLTQDCHTFVAMWLAVTTGMEVEIDIKPGSFPNSLNLDNNGVIPVAVLTTPTFDAATVDPSTVCFGDAEDPSQRDCSEAHGTGHIEDVDGDGDLDLVLHFETGQTGIDPGDTEACLTGDSIGGTPVEGCDSVRTLGS